MLEGNIVESVEIIVGDGLSVDDLSYFVEKEGRGQSADQLRKKVHDQRICLVLLSPSYGAELGCVCSEVDVS